MTLMAKLDHRPPERPRDARDRARHLLDSGLKTGKLKTITGNKITRGALGSFLRECERAEWRDVGLGIPSFVELNGRKDVPIEIAATGKLLAVNLPPDLPSCHAALLQLTSRVEELTARIEELEARLASPKGRPRKK